MIDLIVTAGHGDAGEAVAHRGRGRPAEGAALGLVVHQPDDRLRQGGHVRRLHDEAGAAVLDDVLHVADGARHDRAAHAHRLEQHHGRALPHRRQDHEVQLLQQVRHVVAAPEQEDPLVQRLAAHLLLELGPQLPLADEHEVDVAPGRQPGGLVVSQFLTLYITPVVYTYLAGLQERLRRRRASRAHVAVEA